VAPVAPATPAVSGQHHGRRVVSPRRRTTRHRNPWSFEWTLHPQGVEPWPGIGSPPSHHRAAGPRSV